MVWRLASTTRTSVFQALHFKRQSLDGHGAFSKGSGRIRYTSFRSLASLRCSVCVEDAHYAYADNGRTDVFTQSMSQVASCVSVCKSHDFGRVYDVS